METVEVIFVRTTAKSVGVRGSEASDEIIWLPISQCSFEPDVSTLEEFNVVSVTAPEWLLEREGLI